MRGASARACRRQAQPLADRVAAMADFIAAIGLVLVIEGLVYAAFPAAAKRALSMLFVTPDSQLRAAGVAAAIVGVLIVWAVRG